MAYFEVKYPTLIHMEKFVVYAFIGVAVTAGFAFLNKAASKRTIKNEQGWYELRMNRLYQIVGVFVGLMGLSFLFLIVGEKNAMALITILILSLGFAALGFVCLLWYVNHRLNFNEQIVSASDFYGKSTSLNWNDVSNITFNSVSGLIKLTGTNGSNIKIHQHLVGLNSFVELMEQQTKWTAKVLKLPLNRKITTT
jgi:hypothetical protein